MATTADYIEFVVDQIEGAGAVRHRKMFGEYMVYVDDRPVLLVCDNTVYIKKIDAVASLMAEAARGNPYQGAKEHYILDIEDRTLALDAVRALVAVTPIPVKKTKKKAP
jgi:TfoX/Sxy family transcriptional regulator of competence genes